MQALLVKMSSLGDVVHTLPAVSDAAAHGIGFDWVVEEAFAPVARRHAGVVRVLPIAWRRWRGGLRQHRHALRTFVHELRGQRYDVVLDAQGLLKSAAVTALARASLSAGLSRGSAREAAASLAYRRRVVVPKGQHAIDRLRLLFAGALGYPRPDLDSPLDYGIAARGRPELMPGPQAAPRGAPLCVLLHGTTWPSKHWPAAFWHALAARAVAAGFTVALPWGDDTEHARAAAIAAATGAVVWPRSSLDTLIERLGRAALCIGVDSGLSHLSAALEVPTVVIYGSTSSVLTGCRGVRVRNLQSDFPCACPMQRVCTYRGREQRWQGLPVEPACYVSLPPERVWDAAMEIADADRVLSV